MDNSSVQPHMLWMPWPSIFCLKKMSTEPLWSNRLLISAVSFFLSRLLKENNGNLKYFLPILAKDLRDDPEKMRLLAEADGDPDKLKKIYDSLHEGGSEKGNGKVTPEPWSTLTLLCHLSFDQFQVKVQTKKTCPTWFSNFLFLGSWGLSQRAFSTFVFFDKPIRKERVIFPKELHGHLLRFFIKAHNIGRVRVIIGGMVSNPSK